MTVVAPSAPCQDDAAQALDVACQEPLDEYHDHSLHPCVVGMFVKRRSFLGFAYALTLLPCFYGCTLFLFPTTPVLGSLVSDCDEEGIVPILVFFRQPQVGWGVVEQSLDKFDINVVDEPEWRSGRMCIK